MKYKFRVSVIITALLLWVSGVHAFASETYSSGYFQYIIEDRSVSITRYFGKEETVQVPSSIASLPVSKICTDAFAKCKSVKTIVLPETIMEIEPDAFRMEHQVVFPEGLIQEDTGEAQGGQSGETETNSGVNKAEGSGHTDPAVAGNESGTEKVIATYQGQVVATVSDQPADTAGASSGSGVEINGDDGTQEQKTSVQRSGKTSEAGNGGVSGKTRVGDTETVTEAVTEKAESVTEITAETVTEAAVEALTETTTEEIRETVLTEKETSAPEKETEMTAVEKKGLFSVVWIPAALVLLVAVCVVFFRRRK